MTKALRYAGISTAIALLTACGGAGERANAEVAATAHQDEGAFSFVVIGDAPYGPKDEVMLAKAVPLIKDSGAPFVVHLGDYKGGSTPCTVEYDDAFAKLVDDLNPLPVFYTPGDNEWTDCDRNVDEETGALYSDLDRLDMIRERFFTTPPTAFGARHQPNMPENASWAYNGVRFGTVHITGTNNGRMWVTGDPLERAADAAAERDRNNLNWLEVVFGAAKLNNERAVILAMQADMTSIRRAAAGVPCEGAVAPDDKSPCDGYMELRAAIAEKAERFGGPVLVMHGDTAPFTLNQAFAGDEKANLWVFNAAGDSGIGRTGMPYGTRDVAMVTFNPSAEQPFSAAGMLTGKAPKAK